MMSLTRGDDKVRFCDRAMQRDQNETLEQKGSAKGATPRTFMWRDDDRGGTTFGLYGSTTSQCYDVANILGRRGRARESKTRDRKKKMAETDA